MPDVYEARLPKEYTDLLPSWLNIDLFHLLLPAACVGSFEFRLLLRALVPVAALVGIVALSVAVAAVGKTCGRQRAGWRVLERGFVRALPVLVFLAYLLLPSVSSGIFASLQ